MDKPSCGTADTPANIGCIGLMINSVIHAGMALIGVTTVILIIYSGIKFITSGGDAKQLESARKTLTYAIIGLVIVVSAFMIVNLIATITGVSCLAHFFDFNNSTCQ